MAVNRFVLNAMSFHGHGAINEIPGIVASKGFKKAFVASDPDLVKFGVTAKVTDLLAKNGIEFEVYSNIKPNPTIENVQNCPTIACPVPETCCSFCGRSPRTSCRELSV